MTAVWAENPGWFAFGVFIHVLLIFLMFLTPFAFVKKYRQQRRAKKQDWG